MNNEFEVHCIEISDIENSESINTSVRSNGGGSVTGSVVSTRTALIRGDNKKVYRWQSYAPQSFSTGDKILVCCKPSKNGEYHILSFINRETGTRSINNPVSMIAMLGYPPLMSVFLSVVGFAIDVALGWFVFFACYALFSSQYYKIRSGAAKANQVLVELGESIEEKSEFERICLEKNNVNVSGAFNKAITC